MPSPAARGSLSRDEIVMTALRLARSVGLTALTMRLLGDELGVWPMAVYHHVPNKEALVGLVADAALAELDFPEMGTLAAPDSVEDWLAASIAQTRAARRLFLRYPGLAEFILSHPPTPNGLRIAEMQVTGLRKLGATPEEAAKIYLTTTAWALTLVQAEGLQRTRPPAGTASTGGAGRPGRAARLAELTGAPTERFPSLAEAAAHFSAIDAETRFEYGMNCVVGGLRIELERIAGRASGTEPGAGGP
jgi:AcrR family transcriptional regulator